MSFWVGGLLWTVLVVLCRVAGGLESRWIPQPNLLVYLAGLAAIYFLAGINIVQEWMRRPIMLFGRYVQTIGPGFAWIDPIFHSRLADVPVQDVVDELEVANVQTHDNVPVSFKLIVTTRVDTKKVRNFVVEVGNGYEATRQRALVSVTQVVGNSELDTILHDRERVYDAVRNLLQGKVDGWGVTVTAVELKDLEITDEQIEQAIAMKARAKKEGEAELERALLQREIAVKLGEAAAVLTPDAWRYKELETLLEMSRSAQMHTVLVPTNLLSALEAIIPARANAPLPGD